MADEPIPGTDRDAVRDVALRWTEALERSDLQELERLMARDIVVVHGDGRTVRGRQAVLAELTRSLESWYVRQRVAFEETIIAGDWAFDRSRVTTTLTPRAGGISRQIRSKTVTLLQRVKSGEWVVARAIGVVEQAS